MFDLETGYRKVADFRQTWMNKVTAANAEKAVALEQLRVMVEWEVKLQEEVSRLSVDLQSFGAKLESAHQNISALELWIKSKKHSIY